MLLATNGVLTKCKKNEMPPQHIQSRHKRPKSNTHTSTIVCSYFAHTARSPDATRRGGASQPNSAFSKSRECCEIALPLSFLHHTYIHRLVLSLSLLVVTIARMMSWYSRRMVRLIFNFFSVSCDYVSIVWNIY